LAAELTVNSRITSIYPRIDSHIPEGSLVPGGRNIEFDSTGHFSILLNRGLPELVVHEVERELLPEG
jgi:hypothetical protein